MSTNVKEGTFRIGKSALGLNLGSNDVIKRQKLRRLQEKLMELHRDLESLDQIPADTITEGIDFYEEVSCFEIEIIKRALSLSDGHQGKAARLLKLNTTTLNGMIRRYHIQLSPPIQSVDYNGIIGDRAKVSKRVELAQESLRQQVRNPGTVNYRETPPTSNR